MSGKRLSFSTKLTYGIGDVASNIFIVTTGMYLLFFLTDTLGVNPALAGTALLFPKLWDVVSDPMMGWISDRTRSRFGRRRPYLLFGAVPFGVSFIVLFLAPGYESELLRAVHVALLFALGCTTFTVINVPYSSMVAEMTADYNERLSLTSFRMIFASVGALAAGALVTPLVALGGGGASGYRFMSLIYAVPITATCLICFWGTRDAPVSAQREVMPPFREQVRIAFRNTPFVMLVLSYFFQALAIGVMMAGFVYYVKYVMALPETAMNLVYPLFLVTAIVFIPVWVRIGARLGKIRAYRIGLVLFCLMIASLFLTRTSTPVIFYIQILILGVGLSSTTRCSPGCGGKGCSRACGPRDRRSPIPWARRSSASLWREPDMRRGEYSRRAWASACGWFSACSPPSWSCSASSPSLGTISPGSASRRSNGGSRNPRPESG
jgi:GPH family glycoside/pentoside/hexuronide:cation symporter